MGKLVGRKRARLRPAINRLSRDLSEASVKPHLAGEAYMSDETVVALVTIMELRRAQAMRSKGSKSKSGGGARS